MECNQTPGVGHLCFAVLHDYWQKPNSQQVRRYWLCVWVCAVNISYWM